MIIDIAGATTIEEQLWRRHVGELIRYATLLVGPNDASDIVSVAFVNVTRRPLAIVDNERAYLFRAVTHEALGQRRSQRRRQSRDLHAVTPTVAHDASGDLDVRRAVATLSVRQRSVVYFTYWEDLGDEAVADVLGISAGAVRRHLARARLRLRKALQ